MLHRRVERPVAPELANLHLVDDQHVNEAQDCFRQRLHRCRIQHHRRPVRGRVLDGRNRGSGTSLELHQQHPSRRDRCQIRVSERLQVRVRATLDQDRILGSSVDHHHRAAGANPGQHAHELEADARLIEVAQAESSRLVVADRCDQPSRAAEAGGCRGLGLPLPTSELEGLLRQHRFTRAREGVHTVHLVVVHTAEHHDALAVQGLCCCSHSGPALSGSVAGPSQCKYK